MICAFKPSEFHYMSARKPCNSLKNRDPDLVPIETSRVALAPKPGVEGSDYINASRMNGHYKQQVRTDTRYHSYSKEQGENVVGAK